MFGRTVICVSEKEEYTYQVQTFSGGVLASTWVVKQREHTGAHVDLDKNVHITIANNNYQLAA